MRELRATIERNGYIFAVVFTAMATGLFLLGREHFAKGQWALLYLLIIGLVAGLSGVRPALLAAVISFFTWNYFFLPPFHTFTVDDPKDWLSLFAFLLVGIAVGLQTGRMREREADALSREREMALLNEFSAHLVSDTTVSDMADLLIREIKRATGASNALLLLPDESGKIADKQTLPNDILIPLRTASSQEGVLFIAGREDGKQFSPRDTHLLVALANQSAAFLERKRLQAIAVQAGVLQEADKLKSTLISSVSHELKTPLSSVTATISNLLEQDIEWDDKHVREELQAIQDDLLRLGSSIESLLDLSRLESAAWEPHRELLEFGEILGTAIARAPQKQRGRISFDVPDDLPMIRVDFLQWTRVLENLLVNALTYSPEDTEVIVSAFSNGDEIRIQVEDSGPGIAPEDRERIFDKFFRGKASIGAQSGTGLGLAITREIVRYHGGKIWVEDVVPHGARMVISLPKEDEAK